MYCRRKVYGVRLESKRIEAISRLVSVAAAPTLAYALFLVHFVGQNDAFNACVHANQKDGPRSSDEDGSRNEDKAQEREEKTN